MAHADFKVGVGGVMGGDLAPASQWRRFTAAAGSGKVAMMPVRRVCLTSRPAPWLGSRRRTCVVVRPHGPFARRHCPVFCVIAVEADDVGEDKTVMTEGTVGPLSSGQVSILAARQRIQLRRDISRLAAHMAGPWAFCARLHHSRVFRVSCRKWAGSTQKDSARSGVLAGTLQSILHTPTS